MTHIERRSVSAALGALLALSLLACESSSTTASDEEVNPTTPLIDAGSKDSSQVALEPDTTADTEGPEVPDASVQEIQEDDDVTPTAPGCKTDADCDDQDPCTQDVCILATGSCSNLSDALAPGCGENEGSSDWPVGSNDPCETSLNPGCDDPAIMDCLCPQDPYCCEFMWDQVCVDAAESWCGAACGCTAPGADISCSSDDECGWCNGEDLCLGIWACVDGACVQQEPTVCEDTGIGGCVSNVCDPWTGHCQLQDNGGCNDSVACTEDLCDLETGHCSNEEKCGTNHPCESGPFPTSNDEKVTDCVCNGGGPDGDGDGQPDYEGDTYCCEVGWDGLCVDEAEEFCGVVCECTDPEADLNCETDDDCGFCGGDACLGVWACEDGTCVAQPGLVCPQTVNEGCLINTCDPDLEACALKPTLAACDDHVACTVDHCNPSTGACTWDEIPGCSGEPPFPCLGFGEPSAEGCAWVESMEGCCDPWGRALWCQATGLCLNGLCLPQIDPPPSPCETSVDCAGDDEECLAGYCLWKGSEMPKSCESQADCGQTMCVNCAQDEPSCGWTGNWYLCGTEGAPSGDPATPMECPGL